MKEVSNNIILLLSGLAVMSLIFSFWVHYETAEQITGLVTGVVNVTVNRTVSITLSRDTINFTTANTQDSKNSYTAGDLVGAPLADCGGRLNTATCGINITNDGTVTTNITMRETGTLFASSSYNRIRHFLYNVSVPLTARTICPNFYSTYQPQIGTGLTPVTGVNYGIPASNWTPVNATAVTIICGLNFTNSGAAPNLGADWAAIEINLTVPPDETSGTKGTTLEILGVFAGYD